MSAIADFFRRHHAVPATDAGPTWSCATEAVLLDWFGVYADIVRCGWNREAKRDATPSERSGMTATYGEIVAEVRRRAALPNPSPEIMGAYFRASMPVTV